MLTYSVNMEHMKNAIDNIQQIPNVRSLNEFEIYKQICRLKLISNISVMCQLGVEILGISQSMGSQKFFCNRNQNECISCLRKTVPLIDLRLKTIQKCLISLQTKLYFQRVMLETQRNDQEQSKHCVI